MGRVIFFLMIGIAGFWMGTNSDLSKTSHRKKIVDIHPEKEFPLVEHKTFVFVVHGQNDSLWCERALRSIFEQDYDHYRVVFIDDGSTDDTTEKVKKFIVDQNQEERLVFIRNENPMGFVATLYRAIDGCLDKEIVFPLHAKDWLSNPCILDKLNRAYQNPDVWITFGRSIEYPTYKITEPDPAAAFCTYYAGLFKQIPLQDLYKNGEFTQSTISYIEPILDLSGGRIRSLPDPVGFSNCARSTRVKEPPREVVHYKPLSCFPQRGEGKVDILIFSFDRPLQLYACLESVQRYMTGFDNLIVLYRTSDPQFEMGYERLKEDFPLVQFIPQSSDPKRDFKKNVIKILQSPESDHILFGVDDIIVKDFVDLKGCMEIMGKTGAYGFYLRLGRHINHCYQTGNSQELPPSLKIASDLYVWDFNTGGTDWRFPNSVDMTLYRKETVKEPLEKSKFKTPNSLEFLWTRDFRPKKGIGLYFESSKIVNIPMNIVGKTGNPHMSHLETKELLTKFNQGLKIDIDPLYRIENASPHMEYIPEFIAR